MKVLVTGGAGFVGGHMVRALLELGHEVRILDSVATVHNHCEVVRGDLRDPVLLQSALHDVNAVFHFAAVQGYARHFSEYFDVNARGTALLYELAVKNCLDIERVVVASSQAVYGEGRYLDHFGNIVFPEARSSTQLNAKDWDIQGVREAVPTMETDVRPHSPYGISKRAQESIALSLGARYDIPTTCLRYSIVQGPGTSLVNQYAGAARNFIMSFLAGVPPVIYEDGCQLRDYVDIDDVVDANLLALTDERVVQRAFSVGGGRVLTVLDLASATAEACGCPFEFSMSNCSREGETRHVFSDISTLAALGWSPKRTIRDSLAKLRDWLNSTGPTRAEMRERLRLWN